MADLFQMGKGSAEQELIRKTFRDKVHFGDVIHSYVSIDGMDGNIVMKPAKEVPTSSVKIYGAVGNTIRMGTVEDGTEIESCPEKLLDRVKIGSLSDSSLDINGCEGNIVQVGDLSNSKVYINGCEGTIVQIGNVKSSSLYVNEWGGRIELSADVSETAYDTSSDIMSEIGKKEELKDPVQVHDNSASSAHVFGTSMHTGDWSIVDQNSIVHLLDDSKSKVICPIHQICHSGVSDQQEESENPFLDTQFETEVELKTGTSAQSGSAPCRPCERVELKFTKDFKYRHVFIHHMGDFRRKASERAIRKKSIQNLGKKVCALRNTCGGDILIHLSEQTPGDRYLGHFDEFISRIFPTVAEYGEMATDTYNRQWLCEIPGFEYFQNFVLLSVTKSPWLVTVDFNTKIRNDYEIAKPSHLCIVSLLSKPHDKEGTIPKTTPRIRGISTNPQTMHESRHIELKAFRPQQKVLVNLMHDATKVADYIWYDLKLKDSVTSMSKVPDGGSHYVGISERITKHSKYDTFVPEIGGFKVDVPEDDWLKELLNVARSNLSVIHRNGATGRAPEDLLEMKLHWLDSEKYVLEVAVRYFDGIVFSDSQGPRSYKIINGKVVRMPFEEWLWEIHRTKSHFRL